MLKSICILILNRVCYFNIDLGMSSLSNSLVPRPSYHGVPVRGPGSSGLRMRLIKTARYA